MAKWGFGRIAAIRYPNRPVVAGAAVFVLFLTPFLVLGLLLTWGLLVGIIVGGWLYLISALVVAAKVYQQLLWQQPIAPDDAIE